MVEILERLVGFGKLAPSNSNIYYRSRSSPIIPWPLVEVKPVHQQPKTFPQQYVGAGVFFPTARLASILFFFMKLKEDKFRCKPI